MENQQLIDYRKQIEKFPSSMIRIDIRNFDHGIQTIGRCGYPSTHDLSYLVFVDLSVVARDELEKRGHNG